MKTVFNIFAVSLFDKITYQTIRQTCYNELTEDVETSDKNEVLSKMIELNISNNSLVVLLSFYGIEAVALEWNKYMESNTDKLLEKTKGEMKNMALKMEVAIKKFENGR